MMIDPTRIPITVDDRRLGPAFARARGHVSMFARGASGDLALVTTRMNQMRAATVAAVAPLGRMFGVTLGAAGMMQLGRSVRGVVADVDELVKSARKVGVSFEDLQRMRYGFQLLGVEADTTNEFLSQFARRIAEAASKGGELADVLAANGVAIRDADGNIRPLMELFRDYANLVRGARSENERLQLVHIAGGRAASDFALAMRDGAAGVDAAMKAADDAGVVLSNDLAPSVEEVNDAFTKLAAKIDTNYKRAVLGVIADVKELQGLLSGGSAEDSIGGRLAKWFAETFGHLESAEERAIGTLRLRLKARLFGEDGFSLEDFRGYTPPGETGSGTVIPTKPSKVIQTREERDAVAELIAKLAEERDLIGASAVEREVANALRQAGAKATAEQRAEIEALVREINEQTEALRRQQAAQEAAAAAAKDFIGGFARDMRSGLTAVEALTNAVGRLADRLLDMALDQAINALFSALASGLGGGFANAGGAGGMGIGMGTLSTFYHTGGIAGGPGSGRRLVPSTVFAGAPRMHDGGIAGLMPNEVPAILKKGEPVFPNLDAARAFGGVNVTYAPVYNVQGSGPEIDRLRVEMAKDRAEFHGRVVKAVSWAQSHRQL